MNKIFVRSNFTIGLLLVASFLLKIFSYQHKTFGWDESVYLAMGKYLYSGGEVGYIEPFRPIVWPLILGLLWKLHLDVVFIGMVLQVIFGLGTVYLVYLLAKKVFNEPVGLLAAALFTLCPGYHYFNNTLLTDIPGAFVALCAVFAVLNQKYFLSGLIAMLAFLTRFTQALTVEFIFIFLLLQVIKSKKPRPLILFVTGVVSLLIPYLIYNYCLYGDFLKAFIDSKVGYGQYTIPWHEGMVLVISALFTDESYVFIFLIPAILYIFFRNFSLEALLLLALGIAHVCWVGKLPIGMIRYLISCFPYLYLLSAVGIYVSYLYLNKRSQVLSKLFIVFIFGFFLQLFLRFTDVQFAKNQIDAVQQYAIDNQEKLKKKRIWMSNPQHFVHVDLKINEHMYSLFNVDRINYLKSHLSEADYIFLDSIGLDCPKNTEACNAEKWKLFDQIRSEFDQEVFVPNDDGKNMQAVFKNKRLD